MNLLHLIDYGNVYWLESRQHLKWI